MWNANSMSDRITPNSESQATFRPFNPEGPMRVYVRNLPHWRQPGATYFVTMRQDDSIPASVLAQWLDIRERWFRAHHVDPTLKEADPSRFDTMYRKIPVGVRRAFERQQARMLHEELDRCHGSCLLRHAIPRKIVLDSLAHFHGQRLWLGDVVMMPNHIHALVTPIGQFELEDVLGSIKKWTARLIKEWLIEQGLGTPSLGPDGRKERLWQHESYDRIVRDVTELTNFRGYIFNNPEVAKVGGDCFGYVAAPWLDEFAVRANA